ncbi:MAG: hypothetical protein [Microvirus sp.]|nr:MAG: hypothetical protein [Microvirus sp.]
MRTASQLAREASTNRHEVPDPVPMEIPTKFQRPETMQQMMERMLAQASAKYARDNNVEEFDEANDFDIDDEDVTPLSRYELSAMQEETPYETGNGQTAHQPHDHESGGDLPPGKAAAPSHLTDGPGPEPARSDHGTTAAKSRQAPG